MAQQWEPALSHHEAREASEPLLEIRKQEQPFYFQASASHKHSKEDATLRQWP
jgi:hypothetical protein